IFRGFEKVILGTSAFTDNGLVTKGAALVGAQSIVVSIDYKKNIFGKRKVFIRGGSEKTGMDPIDYAKRMEDAGAGELIIHSIERDGMFTGYDADYIGQVANVVGIPIVACGGASSLANFAPVIQAGASAV